jgi:hypothetical protein
MIYHGRGIIMSEIMLTDLIKIDDPTQYKLHLGCKGPNKTPPLEEYATDRANWLAWNRWRGTKNDWNKNFIFSFIQFHHITNAWLFGGVFRVIARHDPGPTGENSEGYDLEWVEDFEKYEGRLICKSSSLQGRRGQGRAFLLEPHLIKFEVLQILPTKYDGTEFPGYSKVNISFAELKPILIRQKQDWMKRLDKMKCVYLIMDTSSGKYYVGSAYSGGGIWSRLSDYINTGHGWDQGLVELLKEKENQAESHYALKNFKFSLLEIFTDNTFDEDILNREEHWKQVLMSREFGHFNRN